MSTMSAGTTSPSAPPPVARPTELFPRTGRVRFRVSDAMRMVNSGILPEDVSIELLGGEFVFRDCFDAEGRTLETAGGTAVEGVRHNYVVLKLGKLAPRIDDDRRHLRTQSTLVCGETYAPIPDAVVLRGPPEGYAARLPIAVDAWCVVEVADSSYERDAGEKLAGYARAGVRQYVIINLGNRTAEIYAAPDPKAGTYPPPRLVAAGEPLALRVGEDEFFTVLLSDVLP